VRRGVIFQPTVCWITACGTVWDVGPLVMFPFVRCLPIRCPFSCEHGQLTIFAFPTDSGTSRTHHLRCSVRQRTTTISCKASRRPLFALPRSKKMRLTRGFSRTVYAGPLRAALWHPGALMWHLSVRVHLGTFWHPSS
jgi:hypothetical protein